MANAAEKKIGRKLKPWEVVHHINRSKLDNRLGNLFECRNQWHHDLIHLIDAMRKGLVGKLVCGGLGVR